MKIYRIQNQKNAKYGAYNSDSFQRDFKRHPLPTVIKLDIETKGFDVEMFFYGFKNLKQLKTWFHKKDRISLDRDGYLIAVYEVPKKYCYFDKYQAAFYLEKAKFIRDIDLVRMK